MATSFEKSGELMTRVARIDGVASLPECLPRFAASIDGDGAMPRSPLATTAGSLKLKRLMSSIAIATAWKADRSLSGDMQPGTETRASRVWVRMNFATALAFRSGFGRFSWTLAASTSKNPLSWPATSRHGRLAIDAGSNRERHSGKRGDAVDLATLVISSPDFKRSSHVFTRRYFLPLLCPRDGRPGAAPSWLLRAAAQDAGKRKVLVAIFQRGAADGLNVVFHFSKNSIMEMRPTIAVPQRAKIMAASIWMALCPAPSLTAEAIVVIAANWQLFTPPVHPIRRAPISTLKTSWNRARRDGRAKMAGSIAPSDPSSRACRRFAQFAIARAIAAHTPWQPPGP